MRPVVGIVGLGYVGSAVAAGFGAVADVVFHDPARPGSVPLGEVADADVVFVCVPTPRGPGGGAELATLRDVVAELARTGSDAVVVVKSTVPPGTTEDLAARHPGLHLGVAPEFLRERYAVEDFARPYRFVLGWPSRTPEEPRERLRALVRRRFPDTPLFELDATEAELTKYAANTFFAVKVSFANELGELAERLGLSWERIRQALVADPRIADDHLRVPGPDGERGFGGNCLPKDATALLAVADRAGVTLPVLRAAIEANHRRRPAG